VSSPHAARRLARTPAHLPARRRALPRLALAALVAGGAWAPPAPPRVLAPADLAGEWTVDLRPTADAPAYLKTMRLAVAPDNAVTGTFYDSPILAGRAGAGKGRTCFAFTTRDGSGPYHTAGCLAGDRVEGQTWAEGRGFLLTWTATRGVPSPGTR
jgi:hypothetical protein